MNINIIGPIASGKSTISLELSNKLNLQRISFDHIKHYYFYKKGFSSFVAHNFEKKSFLTYCDYVKEFELFAVESVISEFKNCIIDFGGGILWNRNQSDKNRIIKALSQNYNFLLLPSTNESKSNEILFNRLLDRVNDKGMHINMISHIEYANNRKVINSAILKFTKEIDCEKTHKIYTENKNIEEITEEIVALILRRND